MLENYYNSIKRITQIQNTVFSEQNIDSICDSLDRLLTKKDLKQEDEKEQINKINEEEK